MDKLEILIAFLEASSETIEKLPRYLEEARFYDSYTPKEKYTIDALEAYSETLDLALDEVYRKLNY